MGMSPTHGRNVALVLNRDTGLVSPQFHVTFDTGFQTVKQLDLDSKWQSKTYFTSEKETSNEPTYKRKINEAIPRKNKKARVDEREPEGAETTANAAQPEGAQANVSTGVE